MDSRGFDRVATALNYHVHTGGVLCAENWNQHEHRCLYLTDGSRHRHAISPRRATDSRPELAHRMVEVPRPLSQPRPRPVGLPPKLVGAQEPKMLKQPEGSLRRSEY